MKIVTYWRDERLAEIEWSDQECAWESPSPEEIVNKLIAERKTLLEAIRDFNSRVDVLDQND